MKRFLASLSPVLFLSSPLATAQFDDIGFNAANPIFSGANHVVHKSAGQVRAFTALTQTFSSIAPLSAKVLAAGDHCALIELGSGNLRAFSARYATAVDWIMPAQWELTDFDVEGDMIFALLRDTSNNKKHVAGYSAQNHVWNSIPLDLAGTPEYAVDSGVIVVRDDGAVHGMSARIGLWESHGVQFSNTLRTSGNVALVNTAPPGGGSERCSAFSGTLGLWADSPPLHSSDTAAAPGRNVGYVRTPGTGGDWVGSGFSASLGTWTNSTTEYMNGGAVAFVVRENVVAINGQLAGGGESWDAFGARSASGWQFLSPDPAIMATGEDSIALRLGNTLFAFSGLRDEGWSTVTATAPFVPAGVATRFSAVLDAGSDAYAFSPAAGNWSVSPGPVADQIPGGSVLAYRDNALVGYTTQQGAWLSGPSLSPSTVLSTASGGSLAVYAITGGPANELWDLYILNGRLGNFMGPLDLGNQPEVFPGGNNAIFVGETGMFGYSVQRDSLEEILPTAGGAWTFPLGQSPTVEENVAWFIDGDNRLCAYSSTNEVHTWFNWPEGPEYHVTLDPLTTASNSTHVFSIRSAIGSAVSWWYSLTLFPFGIPVAGTTGLFWLAVPRLGVIGPGTQSAPYFHATVPVPEGPPQAVRAWAQSAEVLSSGIVEFPETPEHLWIF